MNRERARELLPIIEAFANGEEIERYYGESWNREIGPCWDPDSKYRIKPKAREFWVAPFPSNEGTCTGGGQTRNGQYVEVDEPNRWDGVIKVREVL